MEPPERLALSYLSYQDSTSLSMIWRHKMAVNDGAAPSSSVSETDIMLLY